MRAGYLWLLMVAATWSILELMAGGTLRTLEHRGVHYDPIPTKLQPRHAQFLQAEVADRRQGLLQIDTELGWAPRRGAVANHYRVNEQGLRNDRLFAAKPPATKTRIATFGDSFTFGDGVANVETFQETMMRLEPDAEVMNFGIPGSSLDQALLRYRRDGRPFDPHVVVLGFLSENKNRVVNTFRPFYFPRTAMPFAKPRFTLTEDGLELAPNPLPTRSSYQALLEQPETVLERVGQHDFWFHHTLRPGPLDTLPTVRLAKVVRHKILARSDAIRDAYDTNTEPYRVTERLFDTFYHEVIDDGRKPIILLFPTRRDLRISREQRITTYQPLIEHFKAQGMRYIDLLDCLNERVADLHVRDLIPAHFTPRANRETAQCLLDALRTQDLLPSFDSTGRKPTANRLARRRAAAVAHARAQPSFRDVPVAERQRVLDEIRSAFDAKINARRALEPSS